jgi:outer membrane protein assembly factor BamB
MPIARRAVATAFALVLAPFASADWPQFRGAGYGTSKDAVPVKWSATENVAWKVDLPGKGTSSPVIVGEKVLLTCWTGPVDQLKQEVVALSKADGTVTWRAPIPTKLPEQLKIREEHGYASSTLAADATAIYAFFGKSGVFAFDHAGKQLWQASVGEKLHEWGTGTSPVIWKDLVFVNASVESGSLVALDRKTGNEVWRQPGIKEAWNTPILVTAGGREELVVAIAGKIVAFDPQTGRPLWSCKTDITWYMAPTMVAADGVVYALGGRSGVVGLAVRAGGDGDVTATHRLWTSNKGSNVASPIYHDGHLYWMNDNNQTAYCADAKTGTIVYEERVPRSGQVYASPVMADGKIYYLGRGGKTVVVPAKPTFEILATNDLERGMYNASPAVSGGKLYIRSDNSLYCIEAK